RELVRHRRAVGFVVGDQVVAEGAAGQIERRRDELRLVLVEQLAKHRDEDVHRVGRRPLRVAQEPAVRSAYRRMIRAVHLRAAVDQIKHKFLLYHWPVMRTRVQARRLNAKAAKPAKKRILCALRALCVLAVVAFVISSAACGGATAIFRQYEYEEEVYLSLDGTATVYVNSSIAALNALRGTSFEATPNARIDTAAIRAYYTSPTTQVRRVSQSRRNGRRFVHVRLDADDVRKLGESAPFAWSKYGLRQDGPLVIYRQTVGESAAREPVAAGWNGREVVAFRLHLPSKIRHQNTHRDVRRGNILEWEQPLADRLRGVPLVLEANMDAQSILYRTLWLFGATFLAVAAAFVVVIWWVMRRPKPDQAIG